MNHLEKQLISHNRFDKCKSLKNLNDQIISILIQIVENITSISFNLLMEKKLTIYQSKDFASKNLLLNINSLLRKF